MVRRGVVVLLALASVLTVNAAPAEAHKPTVDVNPRTGLTYNDIVMVSGSGWVVNSWVWVRQCSGGIWTGDPNACGIRTIKKIRKTGGHFFLRFTIYIGFVGDGECGRSRLSRRSCAIEVVQLDNTYHPTSTIALRRIAFA